MASVNEFCRLCLATDELVSVFDQRLKGADDMNMNEVVFIASGIEIHCNDIISQNICSNCCQICKAIFKFRETSMKSNKVLEDRYKAVHQSSILKYNISDSSFPIKEEKLGPNEESKRNIGAYKKYNIHPTVTNIYESYPEIKLPSVCLKFHVAPLVSVELDFVENYLKQRELKKQPFGQIRLKSKEAVAKKSTSCTISKATIETKSCFKSPYMIEQSQIIPSVSSSVEIGPRRNITDSSAFANIETNHQKKCDANKSQIVPGDTSKLENTSSLGIKEKYVKVNKRKSSNDDSYPEQVCKKSVLIESPMPISEKKNNNHYTDMLCLGKSVPLVICTICDSIHSNPGNLKRHIMRKHLICQFCKLKFKSLETKKQHIDSSCIVKNMVKNLPVVNLERLELNIQMRSRYPEAFDNFPALPTMPFLKSKSREIIKKNYTKFDTSVICIDDIDNCIQETTDACSLGKCPASNPKKCVASSIPTKVYKRAITKNK